LPSNTNIALSRLRTLKKFGARSAERTICASALRLRVVSDVASGIFDTKPATSSVSKRFSPKNARTSSTCTNPAKSLSETRNDDTRSLEYAELRTSEMNALSFGGGSRYCCSGRDRGADTVTVFLVNLGSASSIPVAVPSITTASRCGTPSASRTLHFGQLKRPSNSAFVGNFSRARKQVKALLPCLRFNVGNSPPRTILAIAFVALAFHDESVSRNVFPTQQISYSLVSSSSLVTAVLSEMQNIPLSLPS